MLRIFISHSGCNNREATALKRWLSSSRPELANEIFLDIDEETGLRLGRRWKEQLLVRNTGCEWLVCLVSRDWIGSKECLIEYHLADRTGKNILIASGHNMQVEVPDVVVKAIRDAVDAAPTPAHP